MRKYSIFLACLMILSLFLGAGTALASTPQATPMPVMPVGTAAPDDLGEADMPADPPEEGVPDDASIPQGEPTDAGEGALALDSDENAPSVTPTPTPEPTAAPVVNHDFTIEVDMGYEGLIIMNNWTPTFVTITNNGADFDGMLGVNVFYSLVEYDRYEMPLTLASGATKHLQLPIKPQTRQDMYAFELTRGGVIVAEERVVPTRLAAPETMTIGVLSDTPEELSYLNQRANGLDTLRGEVWLTVPLTAESFPETLDLMSAFSMLVIDGIDVRTLTDAQQEALTGWLLKGGYVFVSGGAKAVNGYPFFAQWTNLTGTGLTEAADITPQLLAYVALKGDNPGETLWLSDLPTSGALITDEARERGLLSLHRAGDGLIFSAAFDMGGKPLSSWKSSASFWPRMLRQAASTDYMKTLNRVEESRYGGNDTYRVRSLVDNMRVANHESGLPVLLILLAYLLIVGFGGYLLLRRIDHREWLWVAAPLSAIVFALLLFGLSRGSTMNKPVALTASRVVVEGDGAQINTYIGVATPQSGELTIETDQRQLPAVIADNYYYYDDTSRDRLYRPLSMRQRYRMGSNPAVGFMSSDAWDVKMLQLSGLQTQMGTLSTRLWMEKDGMHGETINETDQTIKDCFLLTSFGFSQIGDVLPGQTVAFSMLYPEKPVDLSDPLTRIEPNIMYSTLDIDTTTTQGYYGGNTYTYLDAAIFGNRSEEDYTKPVDPKKQQRMSLVELFSNTWSFYEDAGSFFFFGFNDSIGQVEVSLNGAVVERTAHDAIIGNRAVFEPIGPTGQVMFPQGTIVPELMADNGEDKPRPLEEGEADANQNNSSRYNTNYLSIGAPTALRFVLPEWGTYAIERLAITGMSYESLPTMYLYNNETEVWDEQLLLSVSMDGDKAAPYIDEEGSIYVRYVPGEASGRYDSMNMPTIALKGEVK